MDVEMSAQEFAYLLVLHAYFKDHGRPDLCDVVAAVVVKRDARGMVVLKLGLTEPGYPDEDLPFVSEAMAHLSNVVAGQRGWRGDTVAVRAYRKAVE